MQPLNAIDAIAPAFTRTHQTLFEPFRWGRSWKLAASSYLAFAGSVFVPFPIILAFLPRHQEFRAAAPLIVGVLALVTLVFLVVFYLGARMEFVHFEMIVTRSKFIAPMWKRYGRRVWPVIAVKVIIGTIITAAMAPALARVFRDYIAFFSAFPTPRPGEQPDPAIFQAQMAQMMHHMGALYLVTYGFFFLLKVFSTLLNDFVMPFYILEPISLAAAARRGLDVFIADPLQVILYLVLKPILAVIGGMMYFVAFIVAELLLLIPLLIFVFVGALLAAALGSAGKVVLIVGGILLYGSFAGVLTYLSIALFGYYLTVFEAYGIYFLGGRYPHLGGLLEPSVPAPFTPPPSFPSPEEEKDDDGGPPLPMDPALA